MQARNYHILFLIVLYEVLLHANNKHRGDDLGHCPMLPEYLWTSPLPTSSLGRLTGTFIPHMELRRSTLSHFQNN